MRRQILFIFAIFSAVIFFGSCENEDSTKEEYPNWEYKNKQFFSNLRDSVETLIANGDDSWKIIPVYTQDEEYMSPTSDSVIIVNVIKDGGKVESPLYKDTVLVHYYGRLLPSTSYSEGFVFEKSYSDYTMDPSTSEPKQMAVSSTVKGFATALMNMSVDDDWLVYVPSCLGYGASGSTKIPGYSVLIFEINLVAFYHPGEVVPDWK